MMTQGLLPFQYKFDKSDLGMTSFAGLPLYMDMAMATGLCTAIADKLKAKTQGWTDLQIIMSLVLLNLAGGDCVDDIDRLELDEGMKTILLKIETHGMKRKARRGHEHRWRKSKKRAFPSASVLHRYLVLFHNTDEEQYREEGKAFIPSNNDLLNNLIDINKTLIEFAQSKKAINTATLDQDATLSATTKKSAYYCYKKFKAYQPFNTYWHERGLLLHSEFRDGNVNAGFEQLRILKKSLCILPNSVNKVYLRSDSAGYQQDLLEYCAEGQDERFGVIEFAIAARVTKAFKTAVLEVKDDQWKPIYKTDELSNKIKTEQEYAEVCFVPNFIAANKKNPDYRYIAIRERLTMQVELPCVEPIIKELPFQTLPMNSTEYKLFGLVTNRAIRGNDLINWHRERCGQSEKLHSVEKSDFAGGQFPSDKFGANAAWWQVMVLAHNLNHLMKEFTLPKSFKTKRMKAIRFHIIGVAGRLTQHARSLSIKLSGGIKVFQLFVNIREKITALAQPPPGLKPT